MVYLLGLSIKPLPNLGAQFSRFVTAVLFLLLLTSCGSGGGDGGGGGALSGPATSQTFNVTLGEAYTYRATSLSGNLWFLVYSQNPDVGTPIPSGLASVYAGEYDNYSFIAKANQTYWVLSYAYDTNPYRFTLTTKTNHLTVDGPAKSDSTNDDYLYYSFDAVAGLSYEVQLTPSSGDVDIGAVSANMNMSSSFGNSSRTGTTTDVVGFTATTTGRHYIRVDYANTETVFSIKVKTISTEPDLEVVITNVGSDGSDVTIYYTIYNNGINASGAFQLEAWADSASIPAAGTSGDATRSLASIPGYSSITGVLVIPYTSASGTAYLIADNAGAVVEKDENNNISQAQNWVETHADLIVTINSVSSNGVNVAINYTVRNAGARAASAYNLEFWEDAAATPVLGDFGTLSVAKSSLAANASTSGTASIASSQASGNAYAIVDTMNNVFEDNETNNITAAKPWVITYPDLQVVINSVSANGVNATINYTVNNTGENYTGAFAVDFWADAISAPSVGAAGEVTASHTSLYPGGSVSGTVNVPNTMATGIAYAIVDTAYAVTETNEINNVSTGTAWTASLPDLQVVIDRVIADGTNAKISYWVYNRGANSVSGTFDVKVWADSATVPAIGDIADAVKTHDFTTYPLSTVGYTSGTVTVPTTSLTGTAYVIVDALDAIPETNANNNTSAANSWTLTTFSPDTYVDIPDNDIVTGASAAITLSGVTTSLTNVIVGLNISHSYTSQLDIYLESPAGTTIELSTDNGNCGRSFGDSGEDALFYDAAQKNVAADSCASGNYIPEQRLSGLNGQNANGTWILHVYDDGASTVGYIRNFSLSVR